MNKLKYLLLFFSPVLAQDFVVGDALPDAPEFAVRGEYSVGVRTIDLTNKNQPDILHAIDGIAPKYDRNLKVEVWYPCMETSHEATTTYSDHLGFNGNPQRPLIPFTFIGRASRDAAIRNGKYPLIILSHGYLGSRYLMTYLTENLASKGYVVAAIDHKESTITDAGPFFSTLIHRARDIRFVAEALRESPTFIKASIDPQNVAIIGYSMGGYGVLNVAGAAYSPVFEKGYKQFTSGNEDLGPLVYGNENLFPVPSYLKAVVALAPWGMERNAWDTESLLGLKIPTFFVAGNMDDISGYEKGIKKIFVQAKAAERYMLVYENGRHNIAPNAPPSEAFNTSLNMDEYYRFAEPSWDQRRINNINQHFLTLFLDKYLKGIDRESYLNPGREFKGFKPRTAIALELLHEIP